MSEKECTKCGEVKPFTEYNKNKGGKHGLEGRCKSCRKLYYEKNKKGFLAKQKQYNDDNFGRFADYQKQYYKDNKEKIIEYQIQYKKDNEDTLREYQRNWRKDRRSSDPVFRMADNLRCGLWHAMKGKCKPKRTMELLGCSLEQLRDHLSAQFTKGMNLENYGEWHIDHILPVSSFDHSKTEQVAVCWHYSNMQPLWGRDNIIKSNKIITTCSE